jgi:hypothetical protein
MCHIETTALLVRPAPVTSIAQKLLDGEIRIQHLPHVPTDAVEHRLIAVESRAHIEMDRHRHGNIATSVTIASA